jgi:hypothetical protein
MDKPIKIVRVRGRQPYIIDAESVLSVMSSDTYLKFTFDYKNRRLYIIDYYNNSQDYLYGKEYKVEYILDLQLVREEKIKQILE